MSISTGHYSIDELPGALTEIFTEFSHAEFELRQQAVQAGAEVFKKAVEEISPRDTGKYAQSWMIKDKVKNRRYVGNTATAHGAVKRKRKGATNGEKRYNVPLSNVLEYSPKSKHNGEIRRCFDDNEQRIFAAIKNVINNGGN
jgi:hypothetical protein